MKMFVGSTLMVLLATLPPTAPAAIARPLNLRPATSAATARPAWKTNLLEAKLKQVQARHAQVANRLNTQLGRVESRNAAITQRVNSRINQYQARLASQAGHVKPGPNVRAATASATPASDHGLAAFDRLQALRDSNPKAFDRKMPVVGQLLAQDQRVRIAAANGTGTLNGLLPDTPLNRYLHWRRSLDPERFDFYHPTLGPILAEDQHLRDNTNPTPCPGTVTPSQPPPIEIPPQPGDVTPPANPGTPDSRPPGGTFPPPDYLPPIPGTFPNPVPEPASVLLMVIGLGGVGLIGRARLQKAQAAAARQG